MAAFEVIPEGADKVRPKDRDKVKAHLRKSCVCVHVQGVYSARPRNSLRLLVRDSAPVLHSQV